MAKFIKVTDSGDNELVVNVEYIIQFYPAPQVQTANSVLLTTVQNIHTKQTVDELLMLIEA